MVPLDSMDRALGYLEWSKNKEYSIQDGFFVMFEIRKTVCPKQVGQPCVVHSSIQKPVNENLSSRER